jgi:hypothetical protein
MASSFKVRSSFAALFLASCTFAQGPAPELHGTWTAAAGSQTLRGSWGAETSPRTPDAAQGYWTLLNDSGERILQGTWSARKARSRWHGTWTARTAQGQSFSGSWDADMTQSKDKTFVDMLTRTLEKEIAGSWQSGRYGGNWWLKGLKTNKGGR